MKVTATIVRRRSWRIATLDARLIDRSRVIAQERAWTRRAEATSRLPDLTDASDRERPSTSGETT